ncbi:H-NS histone family protein [Alteromonas sp. ASW11-130]|uniref:H-NS histone family protein n=1 Tax=Alteromonas sp. ASW11-130 TaxID=3015775 RepID=UPI002241B423|nr:H-NS family nucleoid-associated regulatory protein [Alteromonas sp. ASW11-130]MCW8092049.1 H-NS histone family protein [Alteromonas sp. ASW11-130]
MNDFLNVLTHGRRLQGAVKDLSIEELEEVQQKLSRIIEKRKAKEEKLQQAEKERLASAEKIHSQMREMGVNFEDLQRLHSSKAGSTKPKKKRPVKYQIKDGNGESHSWTGIGRMPKIFKEALEKGKKLENFSI